MAQLVARSTVSRNLVSVRVLAVLNISVYSPVLRDWVKQRPWYDTFTWWSFRHYASGEVSCGMLTKVCRAMAVSQDVAK